MENNQHLKYFKVENFKCFESFEMNDIGQFNLIVGDNNVGKTSVLESLLFDENIDLMLKYFSQALSRRLDVKVNYRGEINFLNFYFNKKIGNSPIKFYLQKNQTKENYTLEVTTIDKLSSVQMGQLKRASFDPTNLKNVVILKSQNVIHEIRFMNDFFISDTYYPFIPFNLGYSDDLVRFYSEKIQISLEQKKIFIDELKYFIDGIQDIEISQSEIAMLSFLNVRLKNIDELVPLGMFGEGANKLFRYLAEITHCENKKLLIDEVDTGVHYSRFKQYWKTILNSAKRNNVQLFMTTHSLECLKYFKEALEEMGEDFQKESRLFHLIKAKEGNIKAFNYRYSHFSSNIELENEMRS